LRCAAKSKETDREKAIITQSENKTYLTGCGAKAAAEEASMKGKQKTSW
jgi:hypothetical protein